MPESQNLELKETLKISSLSFLIDITYHFHFHYVPSAALYSELRINKRDMKSRTQWGYVMA